MRIRLGAAISAMVQYLQLRNGIYYFYLGAVTETVITELEHQKPNPFKSIKIQGEGKDAEKAQLATVKQLKEIAQEFLADKVYAPDMPLNF